MHSEQVRGLTDEGILSLLITVVFDICRRLRGLPGYTTNRAAASTSEPDPEVCEPKDYDPMKWMGSPCSCFSHQSTFREWRQGMERQQPRIPFSCEWQCAHPECSEWCRRVNPGHKHHRCRVHHQW